jgi:hypothetical protein
MPDYMVLQIHASGGIVFTEGHRYQSDREASDAIAAAHPGKHMEIWQDARLVRVLMPEPIVGAA